MNTPDETPVVTFGDVVLGGATLYDWELSSGVSPADRTFTVSASRTESLKDSLGKLALRTPQTLTIKGPRATITIERLYLLEILPGDDPNTARLRIADERWLWPKTWIATSFNVRRTTGERFLVGEGRIENKLIQPEIKYARWSLQPIDAPTSPWTPKQALEHVAKSLGMRWRFEDEPPEVELQDVVTDDPGPGAFERVLAAAPGMDLYLDEHGVVVFYDRFSGKERAVFARLAPPQRDGPWVSMVDRSALRPSKVVVLFQPEPEMRLDHVEPLDDVSTARVEDTPTLYQVAPLPDAQLTIDGQLLARSSWVELSKLFAAWGAFGIFNRQILFADLRRHAFKYGWAQFEQAWGNNPLIPPDAVSLARAQTASRHWRHTFRLDRFWTQRLAGIRAYRAAIVNPDTGAYAPASVYSDWTRRPSYKGFAKPADPNTQQGWMVRGWSELLSDCEPAPARVDVLDEAAGILTVTPQIDPYGLSQAMALGYPEGGLIPSQNPFEMNRTGQEVYAFWDRVVLEASWKMSIVLTVVPASPNDLRRFHAVEVDHLAVEAVSPGLIPCDGPVVYARVFPGVMTARFAWSDDQAEAIRAAVKGEGAYPEDLLVNREFVQDVALATAKRIYDTLRDRPAGGANVDMDPSLKPTGTISSVRHSMAGGETISSLGFNVVSQPADIWRYLNASTRKAINRILNTPPSAG